MQTSSDVKSFTNLTQLTSGQNLMKYITFVKMTIKMKIKPLSKFHWVLYLQRRKYIHSSVFFPNALKSISIHMDNQEQLIITAATDEKVLLGDNNSYK